MSRWVLVAWAAVLAGCSFLPPVAVLVAAYCGSDWEAPCAQHTTAAYWTAGVLVAIPVAVAVVAGMRTRTRWLIARRDRSRTAALVVPDRLCAV